LKCPNFQVDDKVRLSKVILFHKRSTYQLQAIEHRDKRFIQLLEQEHVAIQRVKQAHTEHTDTLDKLAQHLKEKQINYSTKARSSLANKVSDFDMLIAVGGDGTFLDASHYLDEVLILGVNSALSSSFGHFCLANENTFASILNQIESGAISPVKLMRLTATLNGKTLPYYALNEILVAHKNPAATSRYILSVGNKVEEQLSSGIWISTSSGSTGSMRAAGGKVLPIASRQFQYLVREPCIRPAATKQLLAGLLKEDGQIKLISQMRQGTIFIDGQHIEFPFSIGDEVIIKAARADLNAFVDAQVNKRFGLP
jgi:NAD+ kinase